MDKNTVPNEYPIQVTDWVTADKYLVPWRDFLEKKGIKTYTESDIISHRGRKQLYFRLHRSITQQEEKEIANKEFWINNGFIMKTHYEKKDNNLRDVTTYECIRCGELNKGHDKSGYNVCPKCKRLIGEENA